MRVTQLRVVSIGRVVEDLPVGSKEAKLFPIEMVPSYDGELKPVTATLEDAGVDSEGNRYTTTANIATYITAKWLSLSTNRMTCPNLVVNEQVKIWQYGDSDKYYWTSMGRDDDLRRLETIILAISDLPEKSNEELDENNTYFLEVSSHAKRITLSTSKRNGEYCRYKFQFDLGAGNVTLEDDIGNFGFLDSANTKIKIQNARKTSVELDKNDINIYAPGNMTTIIKKDYTLRVDGKIVIKSGGPTEMTSSGMTITAPATKISGTLDVGGAVTAPSFNGNFFGHLKGTHDCPH